jgi:hypothetical protein
VLRRNSSEIVEAAPAELGGDRADTRALAPQVGDQEALVLGQIPGADLANGQMIERRDEPDDLAVAVGLVAASPVRARRSRHTDLAGGGQDAPATSPQFHEPLTLGRLWPATRPLLHTTH